VAVAVAQWTYDAYGAVISADHLLPHPMNKVGHKGLFAERLDVGVADATVQGSMVHGGIGVETPKLAPFGHHIYHNRNRVHNPKLGRFMQSDPNASGVVVMNSPGYLGMMGCSVENRIFSHQFRPAGHTSAPSAPLRDAS
jgi:hypothetical protein